MLSVVQCIPASQVSYRMLRWRSALWYYDAVDISREVEEPHENILIAQSGNELKGESVVYLGGVVKGICKVEKL